ncbi:putative membrane protein [Frankia sp. EI5c]|uniref:YidH family protein n=1 Tax=Frankia sp. EI5c TaxID=683316 RepID=UPI0007C406EC|nr:DUF202 domain-containing protein [Frankia sp. EI5c]OAA19672.1 putative membrane protein [Frankia sp. EI5c]
MIGKRIHQAISEGADPDPRFTLANERTFLAWLRTGLAFIAAGVAVDAAAPDNIPAAFQTVLAILLMVAGGAMASDGFRRWLRTEQALRAKRTLPAPAAAPVISALVGLLTGVLIMMIVLR